jgi:UDP-glucose 6-dehydrogenase
MEFGRDLKILDAVEAVNEAQKTILVEKIEKRFGKDLSNMKFALWGLAFKPNTDDMREAPSRIIIGELVKRGASVVAYDPVAMPEAKHCLEQDFKGNPEGLKKISMVEDPMAAVDGCDALVIVTEWKAFRSPDFDALMQGGFVVTLKHGNNPLANDLTCIDTLIHVVQGATRICNTCRKSITNPMRPWEKWQESWVGIDYLTAKLGNY